MNRQLKHFYSLLLILLAVSIANIAYGQDEVITEDVAAAAYVLGYGDVVNIQVYNEEDLTLETQIKDTGTITYPFLGEIEVLGLTTRQVQEKITTGLQDGYLVDPRVSVNVSEYRSFYVSGEVRNSGGFPYLPGLTVRKAISLAGGFTERAAQTKIYIYSDGDENQSRRVKLQATIKPGDVIHVKQRFF